MRYSEVARFTVFVGVLCVAHALAGCIGQGQGETEFGGGGSGGSTGTTTSSATCSKQNDCDNDGYAPPFDCDDHDENVNPGKTEVCGNDVDEDCDGEVDNGCNQWHIEYDYDATVQSFTQMHFWSANMSLMLLSCTVNGNHVVCELPQEPAGEMQASADVTLSGGGSGWSCYAPSNACDYKIRGQMWLVNPNGTKTPFTTAWNRYSDDHCGACNAAINSAKQCDVTKLLCDPTAASKVCTPGQQVSCSCQGGGQGTEACLADGSGYGACQGCQNPNDVDNDNDGQTENQGDCNDSDPSVHSGAQELCDNKDNDCDGQVDEGNVCGGGGNCVPNAWCPTGLLGACSDGHIVCNNNVGTCAPNAPAVAENCNDNIDNDCNGVVNNGCQQGCQQSNGGVEICDGVDNDCDGTVDEGLNCGGAVKMCTVQFDWTFSANQWVPAPNAVGGVFAGWDPPSGNAQSHWFPQGAAATASNIQNSAACTLVHVVNTSKWSCSFQIESGTPSVTFTMGIQNPVSGTGMTWSFDSGSWPGGGYGSFIGDDTVTVAGDVQVDGVDVVQVDNFDGSTATWNKQFSVSCPP